ncbi:hypothetical protein CapIbe_020088 [Capra ibex]
MHDEMQEHNLGHCVELLQRTFCRSPSAFYSNLPWRSLTCSVLKSGLNVTDAQRPSAHGQNQHWTWEEKAHTEA